MTREESLKRTIATLIAVLADDDDEIFVEQEHEVLTNAVIDLNQSNCANLALLSNFVGKPVPKRRRTEVEHDDSFCDEEVPKLSLETFQSLFGVSRRTVQLLSERLASENSDVTTKFRVPLQKRILMMLWILSSQESFRSVGERFGMMAPGNVHYVFYSMCDSICALTEDLVSWPDAARQSILASKLTEKVGIYNTFGVLGCMYIAIKSPDKNGQYYDHKGIPSVCLQGVCDYKLAFLDIHVGEPGSYSVSKAFKASSLCRKLDQVVAEDLSLIANSDYPSRPKLKIVNKCMKSAEKNALTLISKAFKNLKNTFQRLKYLDMQRPQATVKLIQTACTLYNFVLQNTENSDGGTEQAVETIPDVVEYIVP